MDKTTGDHRQNSREKASVEGEGDAEGEKEAEQERPQRTAPPTASVVLRGRTGAGTSYPICQVENCSADLTEAKRYHRRHKVCEEHAKALAVIVAGFRQRFCQQCSRFHVVSEFDEAKRSCRRRLAGHNERRRKTSSSEPQGECSDQGGNLAVSFPENSNSKHFQIG
ncbi:hypothetical protein HPP92_009928 [Vanilla planifolia]|uniref:SBP-type domain-containing protein n=1 Tax=Vanilla planifolia TaxID=51239 RepID=A0A835R470_VANPL|nr:hypothetical protein HPP92_009928 [Vanilla planifolia]